MRVAGDLALARLAWLKTRGALRRQRRRLREPKGMLFALVGLVLVGLWVVLVLFTVRPRGEGDLAALVHFGVFALLVLSVFGGMSNPGVFLPPSDVERLLSAPISRTALLRHRLLVQFGRSMPGLVIVGFLFGRSLPDRHALLVGLVLLAAATAVVQQAASIFAVVMRARPVLRWSVYALAAGAAAYVVFVARGLWDGDLRRFVADLASDGGVRVLTAPAAPLARTLAAPGLQFALPHVVVAIVALVGIVAAMRLANVDYREATIATSERVAAQLRRMRDGLFQAKTSTGRKARRFRAPWWAGRGPAGAIVWFGSTAYLRRAPSSFITAAVVLAVVFGLTLHGATFATSALPAAVLLAVLGTLYLTATLRLDLRQEVDRLDQWKAVPMAPMRIFAALVTPQWVVVSAAVAGAILVRTAIAPSGHLEALAVAALVPGLLAVWIGLDNAFFLFWPVRALPGPGGSLQHVGRSMLLLLLRGGSTVAIAAIAGGWFAGAYALLGGSAGGFVALFVGAAGAGAVLVAAAIGAVWLGGRALAAYDPARDRPD